MAARLVALTEDSRVKKPGWQPGLVGHPCLATWRNLMAIVSHKGSSGESPGRKALFGNTAQTLKVNVRISLTGKDLEITRGQIATVIGALAALVGWALMR